MHALFVSQNPPYPPDSGGRQRLWNSLKALGQVADVDVFVLTELGENDSRSLVDALGNCRVTTAATTRRPATLLNHARWLVAGDLPSSLWMRDLREPAVRLEAWARPRYDVVWAAGPLSSVLLDGNPRGPLIIDRDNIEERLLWLQLRAEQMWRDPYRLANGLVNVRRWKRFNGRRSLGAAWIVVCSEADVRRTNVADAVVIPNGYEPARSAGHALVPSGPVFLFQGRMTYGPNVDGARYFATRVFPTLRQRFPEAQLRIVGHGDERVQELGTLRNVTVVGYVESIEDELARCDLVVVPLRYGSGTRIKVLEAFAHGVPVVSTRLGVEGIDARPGVHLLVADKPDEFAEACARVVLDDSLRRSLISNARALFEARYTWGSIRNDIAALATEVARSARTK